MLTSIMIGNKIIQARKEKKLSQAGLAQQLSVSAQAVGKWERGESMPDIITFNRLAEVLDVDLNYFSENFTSADSDKVNTVSLDDKSNGTKFAQAEKKLGWDMSCGNWIDSDFSGLKNLHEKLGFSNMLKCIFLGSDLSGLLLKSNNVDDCDFSDSDLSKSHIKSSNIANSLFKNCLLNEAEFSSSHIKGCDFTNADFTNAVFKSSALTKNIITGAIWDQTAFYSTQFVDITFEDEIKNCSFENCSFTKITFNNISIVNTFFKNTNLKRARFINCEADKLTYAFLKNGKADLTSITLLEP